MAALPMGYAVYVEGAGWKELPRWAQAKGQPALHPPRWQAGQAARATILRTAAPPRNFVVLRYLYGYNGHTT